VIRQLLSLTFLLLSLNSFAQIKDIGGIDYTFISNNSSDADFNRTRLWLNFPIKLNKESHMLVSGIKYANINLNFNTNFNFDITRLETIHSLEYTLGYTFLMKNKEWRFTAQISPTLSSNFEDKLQSDDLIWSGGILFFRTRETPLKTRLTLGLIYSQRIGIPAPLPFITYFKEVNEKLNFTIGVPISKVKYFPNKKTSFEGFITLDGYYANLSNNFTVNNDIAEKISMSAIITGIGFDKYYGKRLNLYFKTGYTLRNSLRLLDDTRDNVFDFDMAKSFTFRGGLKFNF